MLHRTANASLIVMAKVPQAGRVKTRLAGEVGVALATGFYRHTCHAVVARLATTNRWTTCLCISPNNGVHEPIWPRGVARIPQGSGDLGQRMQRAADCQRPGPVVIIGTDIPAIRPAHIAAAFNALGDHDAVFGPAPDGGYWLVGLARRRPMKSPFRAVRWSSPYALQDTASNLAEYRIAYLDQLTDVDDAQSLARVQSWSGRRVLAPAAR